MVAVVLIGSLHSRLDVSVAIQLDRRFVGAEDADSLALEA